MKSFIVPLVFVLANIAPALATPPACLLACAAEVVKGSSQCSSLNQIACVCSNESSEMSSCLQSKCGDNADTAADSFSSVCKDVGANFSASSSSKASSSSAASFSSKASSAVSSTAASSSSAAPTSSAVATSSAAPITSASSSISVAEESSSSTTLATSSVSSSSPAAPSSSIDVQVSAGAPALVANAAGLGLGVLIGLL